MNSKRLRSGIIYLLLVLALGAFLYSSLVRRPASNVSDETIASVATLVRNGNVKSIEINGDRLSVATDPPHRAPEVGAVRVRVLGGGERVDPSRDEASGGVVDLVPHPGWQGTRGPAPF